MSREEQLRRFLSRESDPLKHWKLSPVDSASLAKWDAYTEAKRALFFYTDTADAPWTVVRSDDKKRARLNTMRYVLAQAPVPQQGPGCCSSGRSRSSLGRLTTCTKPSEIEPEPIDILRVLGS